MVSLRGTNIDTSGAEPSVEPAGPSAISSRPFIPSQGGWGDRVGIAATLVRREGAGLVQAFRRPLQIAATWRNPAAERLLIAPQDIRTADATIAADIYAGHLVFGGSFVDAHGLSPFEIEPPNDAWAEGVHGFGWLRHLRAANTGLARANARALVEDWIAHSESARGAIAWRPPVVARRLLAWLSQSPMILTPSDAAFYRRFMRSVGRHVAALRRALATGLTGEARLLAALALAEAGLCADGLASARRQGSQILGEELGRQILADGGHVSRDPGVLVQLLLDLLPLRQAYAARSAPVPPPLLHAIDRMIPMIRMFRHGDGTLALFNGMGVTEPDALATVLTYDDVRARPLLNAPHSGYQRLEAAGTLVICDAGGSPRSPFDGRAHAGTLSFELSVGSERLVVNCGRPTTRGVDANLAARSTAAHSTLILDNASSSRLAPPHLRRWFGDGVVTGPRKVPTLRGDDAGTQTLRTSHDGYLSRFGLVHARRLTLERSGAVLHGEDALLPEDGGGKETAFTIRFHLHPSVRPQSVQGGTAVLLTLPSDDRWLFEAENTVATVEESILFAASPGARTTSQIVVDGHFPDITAVRWSLSKISTLRS